MLTLKNITPIINNRMVRWWIVGIAFMAINIVLLDWFKGTWSWSLPWATVASAEICTITRYVINDCWVFGNPHPTWKRCGEYHIANASSFFVWCFIIIALGEKLQVDHRIAAVLATVVSVCLSMATNFLWIWRRTPQSKSLGKPREKLQATSEESIVMRKN
jgi:putative flippase GtrA